MAKPKLDSAGISLFCESVAMMLAAGIGTEIEIETDGEQEAESMDALIALIDGKFGEGE